MNLALTQGGYLPAIVPPILRGDYVSLLGRAHREDRDFVEFIAEREIESQKEMLRRGCSRSREIETYEYKVVIIDIEKKEPEFISIKFGVTQIGVHNPSRYDELSYKVVRIRK